MRHFAHLPPNRINELFSQVPIEVTTESSRHELAQALGATMYVPASRSDLSATIMKQGAHGVSSLVVCLEDSIADEDLDRARANVVAALNDLRRCANAQLPLLFVRPRSETDAASILDADAGELLSGIAIPKFEPASGASWLNMVEAKRTERRRPLYAMPIIESPHLIDPSSRSSWLTAVHRVLAQKPRAVLAVRIGTTDIAGAASLRRSGNLTIYSLAVVRDAIAAIIGEFILDKDTIPAITAGVWEHYPESSRWARPQLRHTLFAERGQAPLRQELVRMGLDKLAEEISLDLANGLRGKTVIHPSHVALVNSMHTVGNEEFMDAHSIMSRDGAHASPARNKMNESKPHLAWAQQVLARAKAFGALAPRVSWVDVLGAVLEALPSGEASAT